MKLRVTPAQLEALLHGHYLDDEPPLEVAGSAITYTDPDAAWRALVDACNLADDWARHWRERDAPELGRFAARDSRSLGALASRVLRA